MGLFDIPCGRPPLPPSKDKKVQEKREKARVPPAERKAVCGRKQLPPSADPKVEARRVKARENALKKREAVKQDKAGDMINQNIRAKIAKKRMAKAKEDANQPAPANQFSGLSSLNKNRINKGKQPRKGIVLKPRPAPAPPAPAPPAPAPSSSSIKLAPPSPSSSKPSASQLPFSNSPVITQFIQNKVTLDKYSLQNRIDTYKSIVESLNELKDDDCLEKDKTTKGFKIKDIVKLETQIGTKSVYGAIYLTSLMNKGGEYPIASKVMEDSESNLRETHLMNQATISILANKTRHFPINYKVSLCIDNKINKKKRLVNYNELFTGDLKTLVEDRSVLADEELMYNLYFQSQLAVASFQGLLQNVHQDCHWGNFLYHTNNESGYYHYKMEGAGVGGIDLDFYLKSCPYNLVIYDYGLARPISLIKKEVSRKIYLDYDKISSAFNSKNSGWGLYKDLPSKRFDDLVNKLRSDIFNYWYQNMKTPQFDKLFTSEMVRIFIKNAPAGLILENAPTNIINKTPFRFTN
jgi:hypothetical protein